MYAKEKGVCRFAEARELYTEFIEIANVYGRCNQNAAIYHEMGIIAQEEGEYKEAKEWYQKSLEIKEKHGDEHGAALTYAQLGNLYAKLNDNLAAGDFYLNAIKRFINSNDPYNCEKRNP